MKCVKCGEVFTPDEIREWKECGDAYSRQPFMCPDCYDRFQRMDLEEQFNDLIGGGSDDQRTGSNV